MILCKQILPFSQAWTEIGVTVLLAWTGTDEMGTESGVTAGWTETDLTLSGVGVVPMQRRAEIMTAPWDPAEA